MHVTLLSDSLKQDVLPFNQQRDAVSFAAAELLNI